MKLSDDLKRLRRIVPNTDKRTGQLYANASELKQSFPQITLYTLFVSDEGEMLIRPHIIRKREPKTPKAWREWLNRNIDEIMVQSVLGGISRVTGQLSKHWSVLSYIGWVGDAVYKSGVARTRGKGNPPRKKGRKGG